MNLSPFVLLLLLFLITTAAMTAPAAETADSLAQKSRAALAPIDGELTVPGLKHPIEVLRDRWGVPHIYAQDVDDLFLAQGFVAAQDRLFQIDLWRRVARGETAELVGKQALEGDRFARLVRYRGDMEAEWASYSPEARRIAAAFTRGINACIDQMGDRLPVEFTLLGYKPAKWQPEDCLGRMSGISMSANFRNEVLRAELIAAVGLEKARRLAPTDPPQAFAPAPGLDVAGIDRSLHAGFDIATKALPFESVYSGSNNWAIAGSHSVSGKPLLASDPHRAISLPSLRYLVHLNGPGWNVIGAGEPALPGVALGHNEHVAWGFTIVGTDLADLYVEETRHDDSSQYKVGDRWEPMKVIREKVKVHGQAEPVELELRFTRHGPVVHQDDKRHRAFALRWVGNEPGGAAYLPSLRLDQAKSARELVEGLSGWKVPALNFVYADVTGHFGWSVTGLTPIRRGWDGLLPVPGAGGAYEWQGFRKPDELPHVADPSSGYVATANHNILPPGYPHAISYEWSPNYRIQRIRKQLEAKEKLSLDDFRNIQHDVTSLPGLALGRLAKTVDMQDAALKPYVELLANWDGVLSRDSKAGPLYAVWLLELIDGFYGPHVPKKLLEFVSGRNGTELMIAALDQPTKDWFGADPLAGRDRLLRTTFAAAVGRVQKQLGDVQTWSWGRLHTTTFRHPLEKLGPAYAKGFSLGPVARPGDGLTPNNTRHEADLKQVHGATYRHVLDLADWDRGLATSAPGQSGQPGSPHYADLLPSWEEGQYFPLAFSRKKVEEVTKHRLVLKPKP
jgi:penicillin amidase